MTKLAFMSNQMILYIPLEEIVQLQYRNRKVYLKTIEQEYVIPAPLRQYNYLCQQYIFKKINRTTIINYNVITYIDNDECYDIMETKGECI